ncbi:MAG: DUF3341 domain-containing protein [Verrucomicrobiota bacterium]|jgi:ActD protein
MNPVAYGLIAEFDSPAAVLRAAEKVRDAGFRRWDVFSPFPVHGLDKVMGFKNSLVGWFALVFGGGAFIGSMLMIWFMNDFDYPIIVGGKPMFSAPQALVPSYILLVLASAVGAFVGMVALNRFPRLHHPLFKNNRFAMASRDKFFLVIEASDPKFSETETRALLESAGSTHLELALE